jgi:hypothetical protein
VDNGVNPWDSKEPPKYVNHTHLGARVGQLNPSWNQPSSDDILYARFLEVGWGGAAADPPGADALQPGGWGRRRGLAGAGQSAAGAARCLAPLHRLWPCASLRVRQAVPPLPPSLWARPAPS